MIKLWFIFWKNKTNKTNPCCFYSNTVIYINIRYIIFYVIVSTFCFYLKACKLDESSGLSYKSNVPSSGNAKWERSTHMNVFPRLRYSSCTRTALCQYWNIYTLLTQRSLSSYDWQILQPLQFHLSWDKQWWRLQLYCVKYARVNAF